MNSLNNNTNNYKSIIDAKNVSVENNEKKYSAKDDNTRLKGDFGTFVKLLTTQLNNQDPTSPLDTSVFTQQIVNLTIADQAVKTNDHLEELVDINKDVKEAAIRDDSKLYDMLYMSKLINKEVSATGNSVFKDDNEAQFFFNVPAGAVSAKVTVKNIWGDTIAIKNLKSTELLTGLNRFVWDGKDSDGYRTPRSEYKVEVEAFDSNKGSLEVDYDLRANVSHIELMNGKPYLMVTNIPLNIKQINGIYS